MRVVVVFAANIRRRSGIQAAVSGPCRLYDWKPWIEVARLERWVLEVVGACSWDDVCGGWQSTGGKEEAGNSPENE